MDKQAKTNSYKWILPLRFAQNDFFGGILRERID